MEGIFETLLGGLAFLALWRPDLRKRKPLVRRTVWGLRIASGVLGCWGGWLIADTAWVPVSSAVGTIEESSSGAFAAGKVGLAAGKFTRSAGYIVVSVPEGKFVTSDVYAGRGRLKVRYRVGRFSGEVRMQSIETKFGRRD